MKTYLKCILFWLCGCLPLALFAAAASPSAPFPPVQAFPSTEPEFETLHDATAIDNQTITALVQDQRGLIWIGTQTGLVRYDGYRFHKFVHKASDPFSLAGDYVSCLSLANDGRIWVGTPSDGISVFDPASERFEHFRHDEKVPDSPSGGRIWSFANDGRGGMWVATNQGLDHWPGTGKGFGHFRHSSKPNSLLDNKVRSLLLDKAGRLWVGSSSGLQRLAPDGKSFETRLSNRNVQSLLEAQDGKLWLGTLEHGVAWLDNASPGPAPPGGSPQQVHWLPLAQLSHPWIAGMAQVSPEQIWLASHGGGIMVLSAKDGQVLQTLRHDPLLPGSLAFDTLKPLLPDRAGWLWVGTWGAGLQRIDTNNTMLRVVRHSPKRANGLSHPNVQSVLELADGRLLIGTNSNGIDIFDRHLGHLGGYRPGQGQPGTLPNAPILSLAQSADGTIWAGTQSAGLVRQLPGSNTWLNMPGLPGKTVAKLLLGRDGTLWAGTIQGVARWQPPPSGQALPSPHFEPLTDERGKPMESRVAALAGDRQGRIWIGTQNGLWLHQPGHQGLIHIPSEPTRPDGLVSNHIVGLLADSQDRLWVTTDKGVERLKNLEGKLARFEHVSTLLGLPGQALGGNLLEDRQGRIWTEEVVIEGAATHRTAGMHMRRLTPADGMSLGTTWIGSHAQTRDGLLLYGGTKGLAVIDPSRFKAYDYAPPLVVTGLKINGETVPPALLANPLTNPTGKPAPTAGTGSAASLILEPAQRNFAIEFAALDYAEPKKNRYQYRLQDYDKNWITTDSDQRSATYGNLWPGSYTLQVRGSNRLGDWSSSELTIPIRVLPAWWQTWWFGVVLLLLMSSLITALVQTRTRYLRQRQRELAQLVNERTGELRQKQSELVDANQELNASNNALNESNTALNAANADLALSVETLRKAQEQLVQQEKMASLGGLVAGIAHEINTPLGTTLLAVSGAEGEWQTLQNALANGSISKSLLESATAQGMEYNALALKTATRAAELIALFKTIAVNPDNDREVEIELADYLPEVATLIQIRLAQNGSKLEVAAPEGLRIHVVPEALTEALSRILVNVLDHGLIDGRTGTLRLGAQPCEEDGYEEVIITISDDGHGIAAEDLPKVFDPFFTTKSGMHGHVGLGLHVAYNHVTQRLKGKIEVTSTHGVGTCVTIRLKKT